LWAKSQLATARGSGAIIAKKINHERQESCFGETVGKGKDGAWSATATVRPC
jgi:hypothetical protein